MVIGIGNILSGMDESDSRYRAKRLQNLQTFRAYQDLFPDAPAGQFNELLDELAGGDRFLRGGLPGQEAIAKMVERRQKDVAFQEDRRRQEKLRGEFEIGSLMDQALEKSIMMYDDPLEVINGATSLLPEEMRPDAQKRWSAGGVTKRIQTRQRDMAFDLASRMSSLGISDRSAANQWLTDNGVPRSIGRLAMEVVEKRAETEHQAKLTAFVQSAAMNPAIAFGYGSGDPQAAATAESTLQALARLQGISLDPGTINQVKTLASGFGQLTGMQTQTTQLDQYVAGLTSDPYAVKLAAEGQWDMLDAHVAAGMPTALRSNPAFAEQAKAMARQRMVGAGAASALTTYDTQEAAYKKVLGDAFDAHEKQRVELVEAWAPGLAKGLGFDPEQPLGQMLAGAIITVGRQTSADYRQIENALVAIGPSRAKSLATEGAGSLVNTIAAVLAQKGVSLEPDAARRAGYISERLSSLVAKPTSTSALHTEATGAGAEAFIDLPRRVEQKIASGDLKTPLELDAYKADAVRQIDTRIRDLKRRLANPDTVFGGPTDKTIVETAIWQLEMAKRRLGQIAMPPVQGPPSPPAQPAPAPAPLPEGLPVSP